MLKKLFRPPLTAGLALALGLSSCTVYTPLQPGLPLVRHAGQAELRASLQPTLRAEASVAYSPLNHVVVLGAGSWRPQFSSVHDMRLKVRRAEVGIGTYWPLGANWTLTALGGCGWGKAATEVSDGNIIWSYSTDYFARYNTPFGQLAVSRHSYPLTLSSGYRLTQVRFRELRTSAYDLPLESQMRHEPFASLRVDLGRDPATSRWQTELSGAFSLTGPNPANGRANYDPVREQLNRNRGGALLIALGVLYRPGRRPPAAPVPNE